MRNVHWKIVTYPIYDLNLDESTGQVEVSDTTGDGEADVTGKDDTGFGTEPYSDQQFFGVNGVVVVSDGAIVFRLAED